MGKRNFCERIILLKGQTGVVVNSQANLVNRNLRTVLGVQLKRAADGVQTFDLTALVELCRNYPGKLRICEPFLTDDRVAWLLSEIDREIDPETNEAESADS